MRSFVLALSSVLLAACSGSHAASTDASNTPGNPPPASPNAKCASLADPAAPASARANLFLALSANPWQTSYCSPNSQGPDCLSLNLKKDGSYSYTSQGSSSSDVVQRLDFGKWSLAAFDDTTGLLCLDGTTASATTVGGPTNLASVLYVSLATQEPYITIGSQTFKANGSAGGEGTVDGLTDVAISDGVARLAGKTWEKSNPFDPTISAQEVSFDQSARFVASYATGDCAASGHVSWDKDVLIPVSDGKCTHYGPDSLANGNGIVPLFVDDIVVLGQGSYRTKDAAAGRPNEFVFDPYGKSVRVYGTFDGTLKAGAAMKINLTFENTDAALPRTLKTFSASIQPATLQSGQFLTNGPLQDLGSRDLSAVTIQPGAKYYDTITITPATFGDSFAFAMRLSFSDAAKAYDGLHTYITAVSP